MMGNELNENHVKILVHTKQEDGYPPEEWEGIWATSVGGSLFKIDNIPFYAKGLSCDDIVEASLEFGDYKFTKVVIPSDNSTIRIVIFNLEEEDEIRDELSELGCSIEGTGIPGLIAVNIVKPRKDSVLSFVDRLFTDKRIDFEEGALR